MNANNNKVQLIGYIDTPIITATGTHLKVAEILIGNSQTFRNKKGEKVTETMWHKCKAYGKLAEIIEKYAAKGIEVAIEGSLIQSSNSVKGRFIHETFIELTELLLLTKRA